MIDPLEVMGNLAVAAGDAQHELRKAKQEIANLLDESDELRDEIDRLRAKCEGLRRDAERYRWLRTQKRAGRNAALEAAAKRAEIVRDEDIPTAIRALKE